MAQVNITGTDRRNGICEVLYSSKSGKFLRPVAGAGKFKELGIDLEVTPPGNGKITINDFDGTKVGEFTVNQDGPTVITLPEIQVPGTLNPLGFIDVSQTAPDSPQQGDLYIQYRDDSADVVAGADFVGIAGETVTDGSIVLFGKDDQWHHGGHVGGTEEILQSDWTEEDTASLAYIQNKPDVYVKDEYIQSLPEAEGNDILDGNLEVHPLQPGDKLVLHRNGVDYSLTAQQVKRYVHEVDYEEDPPVGQWFHIKNIKGGKLRINSQSSSVQAIDVLGEASRAAWYHEIGAYHYGHSIRIWDCGGDNADPNLETYETWGDIALVAGGEENVDNFFNDLNFDKSNFLGADHSDEDRERGLWLLPTSKIHADSPEVPNNHQYILYVRSDASWDKMLRPEPGCTYEIANLTNTTNITNWSKFFENEKNYVPSLRYLDVSSGTDFNRMFYQARPGNRLGIDYWNVSNGVNFEYMFAQSDFDADISNWDVSNATNMKEMFMQAKLFSCGNKGTAENGIGQWRPKPEVNLSRFIYQCEKLEYDLSGWFTAADYPDMTGTWLDDTGMRNDFNDKTWLRFPDGDLEQMVQSSQSNKPWETSRSYPYYGYWSAWRFLKNPRYGADQAQLDLWDARKTLWTGWTNWCDGKLADGTYEDWKKIKDQDAKDEFQKYLDDDAALAN